MPVERRERVIAIWLGSTGNGRNPMFSGRRQPSRGGTSRMMREYQVRICERLGGKFPGPTRQLHPLPRRSIAVCFTPVSGIDSRSQALPGRADFVAKVPKYQTTIFLKET